MFIGGSVLTVPLVNFVMTSLVIDPNGALWRRFPVGAPIRHKATKTRPRAVSGRNWALWQHSAKHQPTATTGGRFSPGACQGLVYQSRSKPWRTG